MRVGLKKEEESRNVSRVSVTVCNKQKGGSKIDKSKLQSAEYKQRQRSRNSKMQKMRKEKECIKKPHKHG